MATLRVVQCCLGLAGLGFVNAAVCRRPSGRLVAARHDDCNDGGNDAEAESTSKSEGDDLVGLGL